MKRVFIIGILSIGIILSCPEKKKQAQHVLPVQKAQKKILVNSIGALQFTKSYSFIQSSLLSDKEKNKLFDQTEKGNPLLSPDPRNDTVFRKQFEKLGIVKGDELLLHKFKYSNNSDSSIINSQGEKMNIHIYKDTVGWGYHDKVIIFNDSDSSIAKATIYSEIKYALLDIIPGGNKELVILNEHYLMNTEFYYFEVYEIKTKGQ